MPPEIAPAKTFNPFWVLLFIFALNLALPFLPVPNIYAAVASNIILTLVYVGAVVLFALGVARREWAFWVVGVGFALSAATWLAVEYGALPLVANFVRAVRESGARPTSLQLLTVGYVNAMQDMALLCGAIFGGNAISRLIRAPNMLGPIGAIIALIDIWGVLFGGPISQIMASEAAAPITEKAMTAGPQIGAVGAARPEFSIPLPAIGVGDFLFLALLLGIIIHHRMNWRTPAWATWLLVSGALLSIVWLPVLGDALKIPLLSQGFPLPGLLFIGAGAVLPNLKFFTYTRDERFALLWAGVLVLVMTVGIHFGLQRALANLDDKPTKQTQLSK